MLEGVAEESDVVVRKRRLTVVCRILRCGQAACVLARDLGFLDALVALGKTAGAGLPLDRQEGLLVAEITFFSN